MPELVEVEAYRQLAERIVGRRVSRVVAPDPWFLKRGASADVLIACLEGSVVTATDRLGKLMLLRLGTSALFEDGIDDVNLGLRFGMTGRLIVDGNAGVDRLIYSTNRDDPQWDRFVLEFEGGGSMRMQDPRRLGGVELEPDLGRLGPDARSISRRELTVALRGSEAPLKARLLDQSRIAGIGNLIADEVLWHARIAPARPAGRLGGAAVTRLHAAIHGVIEALIVRGGSHCGELMAERHAGGHCPSDGAALRSATVGGRTTWWCPRHQR